MVDEAASLFTCKVIVVLAPVSTPITIIDVARAALLPNNVTPDSAVPVNDVPKKVCDKAVPVNGICTPVVFAPPDVHCDINLLSAIVNE